MRKTSKMLKMAVAVLVAGTTGAGVFAGNIAKLEVDKTEIKTGQDVAGIKIAIEKPADMRISVWNGKELVRIIDNLPAGKTAIDSVWNGKDNAGKEVKAGDYTIKVESGENISLDKTFGKNGVIDDLVSPIVAKIDEKGSIWVLDMADKSIREFTKDGKEGEGKFLFDRCYNFSIDTKGNFYISEDHTALKLDKTGATVAKYGAYLPGKPGDTTWAGVTGLGPNNKIYVASTSQCISAFDTSKAGADGFLYASKEGFVPMSMVIGELPKAPEKPSASYLYSSVSNPVTGDIYWIWHNGCLSKLSDTGKEIKETFRYEKTGKSDPQFLNGTAGLGIDGFGSLYVASRLNHRVEKLFDTGSELRWVNSFGGTMGNNIEKQEFFGIHSTLPDGNSLYLIEDGEYVQKDKDSFFDKRGNHRLSKWKISYDDTKEIPVKVN